MRRRGISPEYIYESVIGTFNMSEQRVFFGSKMMDVEDTISLDSRDIVYYQQSNNEQIDLNQELNFEPNIYSLVEDKQNNHTFGFDNTQSEIEKNNKTKWVVEIRLIDLLRNYIFSNIKSERTFEGILNNQTNVKNVNQSIYEYVDVNIIDRYQFDTVDFFVEYKLLSDNNTLRYETTFNSQIENQTNKLNRIRTEFNDDRSMVRVFFTQEQNSQDYTFDYYFNLNFSKR